MTPLIFLLDPVEELKILAIDFLLSTTPDGIHPFNDFGRHG